MITSEADAVPVVVINWLLVPVVGEAVRVGIVARVSLVSGRGRGKGGIPVSRVTAWWSVPSDLSSLSKP